MDFVFGVGLVIILFVAFRIFRTVRRWRSLRRLEDGRYAWREWHGGQRVSEIHPAAHFGAWSGGIWNTSMFDPTIDYGGGGGYEGGFDGGSGSV